MNKIRRNGGEWERLPDYPMWDTDKSLYLCLFCGKMCEVRLAAGQYNVPLCAKCRPLSKHKDSVYIQLAVAAWRQMRGCVA